jgi:membrane protein
MWISTIVILIGAKINAELEHQTAVDTTEGRPAPRGERGARMADTIGYGS